MTKAERLSYLTECEALGVEPGCESARALDEELWSKARAMLALRVLTRTLEHDRKVRASAERALMRARRQLAELDVNWKTATAIADGLVK